MLFWSSKIGRENICACVMKYVCILQWRYNDNAEEKVSSNWEFVDFVNTQWQLCTTRHNFIISLEWRHNGRDGVSNHQPHECLLNRLFRRRSKKTPKLRVTGLCEGNSPVTGEFPAQMASNAENASIWWRHHVMMMESWHGNSSRFTGPLWRESTREQ